MKDYVKITISFVSGSILGYFISKNLLEKKYKENYSKEVKKLLNSKFGIASITKDSEEDKNKQVDIIINEGYASFEGDFENQEKFNETEYDENEVNNIDYSEPAYSYNRFIPYRIIPPEEFGILETYEQISLICYSDGVIADEEMRILSPEEINEHFGYDSLEHFGEYEENTVFVRNDKYRTEYEIYKDLRTYDEVMGSEYPRED